MRGGSDFLGLLRVLAEHEVELIVVGGVAAVLAGAPISTFDLDVVHQRSPENLDRLVAALRALHARYRDPAGRHIEPDADKLSGPGQHLLLTDRGPLDVLGTIGAGRGYEELVERCHEYEVEGFRVKVLDLAAVIRSKEETNREKDRAALPALYRALALREDLD
jgi:hypothetical protein